MAKTRSERVEQWRDHVDELCHDGETVEYRVDLEDATVAVTNQRVLALTPDASGGNFRHVDRPNVGTVTVETDEPLGRLGGAFVAAFVGVGLLEAATDVSLAGLVPGVDLEAIRSAPWADGVARLAETALEAVETLLLLVEWGILLLGVAALATGVGLVGSYLRSRSRRLVCRVSGGDDLVLPVDDGGLEDDTVADLERAIRPGPGPRQESESALEGRPGGDGTWAGAEESG